jgi:ADP-ribose pyrophosphatase YjhB (NUDIX family)
MNMKTHVTAGGVLYDPRQKKVYMIYKKERDEWLLPKGHVEEGESVE